MYVGRRTLKILFTIYNLVKKEPGKPKPVPLDTTSFPTTYFTQVLCIYCYNAKWKGWILGIWFEFWGFLKAIYEYA